MLKLPLQWSFCRTEWINACFCLGYSFSYLIPFSLSTSALSSSLWRSGLWAASPHPPSFAGSALHLLMSECDWQTEHWREAALGNQPKSLFTFGRIVGWIGARFSKLQQNAKGGVWVPFILNAFSNVVQLSLTKCVRIPAKHVLIMSTIPVHKTSQLSEWAVLCTTWRTACGSCF